ncbi:MAG: hypothetical protein Q7J31_11435 [Syntrophales bacterium]|nr:hypothetical protein [Syntrophales bacterium]
METNTQNTQEIPFPQKPLWKETLDLVGGVDNIEIFTNAKLIENLLPFNSQESRARYSRAIATRFRRLDPYVLKGFLELVKTGTPTAIIEQIWRVLFCKVEVIFAQMYLDVIWPREPGHAIHRDEIKSYIQTTFPQQSKMLYEMLTLCFRQAGFMLPQGKQDLIIVGFANLEESLLIVTHLLMARAPRTIKISEIEADPYWKFLGYRKFDHVRVAFRNAEAKGMLMRYAVVDHLEQITTRYTWVELLAKLKG